MQNDDLIKPLFAETDEIGKELVPLPRGPVLSLHGFVVIVVVVFTKQQWCKKVLSGEQSNILGVKAAS
jgi:hypothetical protein